MYFQTKNQAASKDPNYMAVQPDWLAEQWDLLVRMPLTALPRLCTMSRTP